MIYTSIEGDIATAYIVADEIIKILIPQPTASKIIIGLICTYYVWHSEYPPYYTNILHYFEHEILNIHLKSRSTTVAKFIRKCNDALNSAENSIQHTE